MPRLQNVQHIGDGVYVGLDIEGSQMWLFLSPHDRGIAIDPSTFSGLKEYYNKYFRRD